MEHTGYKFLIAVETASMNESELAEYARKKGLYVEQIKCKPSITRTLQFYHAHEMITPNTF